MPLSCNIIFALSFAHLACSLSNWYSSSRKFPIIGLFLAWSFLFRRVFLTSYLVYSFWYFLVWWKFWNFLFNVFPPIICWGVIVLLVFWWREKIPCSLRKIWLTQKKVIKIPWFFPNFSFWGKFFKKNSTIVIWSVPLHSYTYKHKLLVAMKDWNFFSVCAFQILTAKFDYCFARSSSFINGSILFYWKCKSHFFSVCLFICFLFYSWRFAGVHMRLCEIKGKER